jgi:phospholipase/carboxylesterase
VTPSVLGFAHRWEPPASEVRAPTLLLLHGTGGGEDDLLPLGRGIAPGAGLLSPRGRVLERGMPRFFRRLSEGVFDEDDLIRRTGELADFVGQAAERYAFDAANVIAAGFSNGANIAAAMLLLRPEVLAAAALFRAMVPLRPAELPVLTGRRVLISEGRADPVVPSAQAESLVAILRAAGASVTVAWQNAGHGLIAEDVDAARAWMGSASR